MISDQKPNVVCIMSDQHSRAVTGCYGHDIVKTPHIDRLAETGIRYDNAFFADVDIIDPRPAPPDWITNSQESEAMTRLALRRDARAPQRSRSVQRRARILECGSLPVEASSVVSLVGDEARVLREGKGDLSLFSAGE